MKKVTLQNRNSGMVFELPESDHQRLKETDQARDLVEVPKDTQSADVAPTTEGVLVTPTEKR